jgi:hypothetical protein
MKQFVLAAALLAACTVNAQDLPSASPKGKVEQVVGLTNVTIEYNRPSARGRKIFGDLVPMGKVWRTGANKATSIEVDGTVEVQGQKLEAGKYSIFTIPAADSWTIIFNKNTELWGEGDRKEEEDVLQVKVKPGKTEFTETFTISFDAVKDDAARLDLRWENTLVSVKLYADATEQALKNIDSAVNDEKADFRTFSGSARFLVDRNLQPELALKYASRSVELDRRFWNVHTLALAQAQNGDYKSAIATAEESRKMAEEAKYDAYIKMNNDKIAEWTKAMNGASTPAKKK